MFEDYFGPTVSQKLHSNLLEGELAAFAATLAEAGYARLSIQIKLRLLARFGEWLRRTGRTVVDVDQAAADRFYRAYRRRFRSKAGDRSTLHHFIEQLQHQGVIAGCCSEIPAGERPLLKLEQRYANYLQKERGLAAGTGEKYRGFVHRFLLERFGDAPLALRSLSTWDVSRSVVKYARSHAAKSAQLLIAALRSFFRFLVQKGEIELDLAGCVLAVSSRARATVPRYISDEEVERLLRSCDQSTPTGSRNYAILLLLARLGLRAGEVAGLQLEDIDWRSGEIRVSGKGEVRDRLPLLRDVGEALVTYLHRNRPRNSCSRHVFLRVNAPRCGFTSAAVSTLVRRALERAGLKPPLKGAHLLRHSLATSLLRKGASMAEIAALLRHRSPGITEIYAKVDSRNLRTLARSWPMMRGDR